MPVSTKVKCYLCGKESPIPEMAFFAATALGPVVDFALSVTYLCPSPCYLRARDSELIRAKIDARHNRKKAANKANLQSALEETESNALHLATLPEGLRVTESDTDALKLLDGDYSTRNLQDEATQRAAFKLLRNHKRLPFYKPDGTEIWDYDETKTRLRNLEGNNG